ncbi:4'-phosphopantetheinyl transferase family protein [Streptomyces fuscigenes]|uniref:4'-phosphopantetheinyl transferase family protein n=1 Tax=Streptomyces fuscigenes TaxID=1528880 RepID=UPI001F47AA7C|nr:4'-phosphopantetheinyl transferase superfamily protein [Streptomyces fuscigenes]MCF3963700.1 4'-phosphopantetheinyl transferase superfamily protein [Streptomyces fuscigenes]
MIAELLPATVTAYDTFADASGDVLFPEERAVVARAVDKRRREFTTVRDLARTAMAELGIAPAPLLPDQRGAPRWPSGLVGSMTHCDGYRAVAVARDTDVHAVGIDAEPNAPLPEGVLAAVTLPAERARIAGLLATHPGVAWDRLVFSIKETIFKAWYPRTRYELDFAEADVTPEADAPSGTSGTFGFALSLSREGPDPRWLSVVSGRWTAGEGVLVTALSVPRTTLPGQRRG